MTFALQLLRALAIWWIGLTAAVFLVAFAIGSIQLVWERSVARRRRHHGLICKLCLQQTPESWSFGDDLGPYHLSCAHAVLEARALYRLPSRKSA